MVDILLKTLKQCGLCSLPGESKTLKPELTPLQLSAAQNNTELLELLQEFYDENDLIEICKTFKNTEFLAKNFPGVDLNDEPGPEAPEGVREESDGLLKLSRKFPKFAEEEVVQPAKLGDIVSQNV